MAERLTKNDILNYCPLNRVMRQWHDRKKLVNEPLFTSYVFVRINLKERLNVLQVNGVLNFVNWLGKPALIRDEEIELIQQFLEEHSNVCVRPNDFQLNDEVRISGGPLMCREGTIVEIRSKTVKLHVPSLNVSLYAEVDKSCVEKTKS